MLDLADVRAIYATLKREFRLRYFRSSSGLPQFFSQHGGRLGGITDCGCRQLPTSLFTELLWPKVAHKAAEFLMHPKDSSHGGIPVALDYGNVRQRPYPSSGGPSSEARIVSCPGPRMWSTRISSSSMVNSAR